MILEIMESQNETQKDISIETERDSMGLSSMAESLGVVITSNFGEKIEIEPLNSPSIMINPKQFSGENKINKEEETKHSEDEHQEPPHNSTNPIISDDDGNEQETEQFHDPLDSDSDSDNENEKGDSFDEFNHTRSTSSGAMGSTGILFEVAPNQFDNFHLPASPRTSTKMLQEIRTTLKGRDASELLTLATEAIEAIGINGNVENNERHICLKEFATKSPGDYEILEEEVDKLALLDLAYSHLAHRVQDDLNPSTLDHLTHRLEIHELMREHDFNEMQRHHSLERVPSRRPSVRKGEMMV